MTNLYYVYEIRNIFVLNFYQTVNKKLPSRLLQFVYLDCSAWPARLRVVTAAWPIAGAIVDFHCPRGHLEATEASVSVLQPGVGKHWMTRTNLCYTWPNWPIGKAAGADLKSRYFLYLNPLKCNISVLTFWHHMCPFHQEACHVIHKPNNGSILVVCTNVLRQQSILVVCKCV